MCRRGPLRHGLRMTKMPVYATMGQELRLEEPSARLRDSYCGLVQEFIEAGERLVPFPLSFPHDDFPKFLEGLSACARGEDLPPGFVAHSTYSR